MKQVPVIFAVIAMVIVAALIIGVRVYSPHDLYEKDQPKTMAYTADIIRNGRWILPRDVIYQPATKPPMYNWLDAIAVKAIGSWDEWVLKLPSIAGSLATGAIVFAMARRITIRAASPDVPLRLGAATIVGCLATAVWFTFGSDVRHGSVLRLGYLARPDMLQCAFLTGAWALATVAIERDTRHAARLFAAGFWACITAAALTKGPAAIMPIAFALGYAIWTPDRETPRFQNVAKLHAEIGIPIMLLCVGGWLVCAYLQDAAHVRSVILGAELSGRIQVTSPEGVAKPFYFSVMWFVTKAMPWGIVALVGVATWFFDKSLRTRWAAAAIYLLVVLACLSIPAGKRMDYLLPAFAPGAVMVALALNEASRNLRIHTALFMLLPLYLAGVLADRHLMRFHESIEHWSDHTVRFVSQVRSEVDLDKHRVFVLVRGKHPITTLLGQHPGSYLTPADLASAEYVIAPQQDDWPAITLSEPVPIGFETIENRQLARLGLYKFAPGTVPVDRLVEMQKRLAEWTNDENPYHEAGTVYRDE